MGNWRMAVVVREGCEILRLRFAQNDLWSGGRAVREPPLRWKGWGEMRAGMGPRKCEDKRGGGFAPTVVCRLGGDEGGDGSPHSETFA